MENESEPQATPWSTATRALEFWRRTMTIYASYKGAQLRALGKKMQGADRQSLTDEIWTPQHTWAGDQMYDLCVSLRGFYLKASTA